MPVIPPKPGEVRNPEGRNQYTYRREAEKHLEEWCREYGRDLIRKVAEDAKAGKPWAAKLLLDRVLPVIQRHEVEFVEDPEQALLADSLASVAQRRRTNGSGRSSDTSRTEDAGP